MDDATKYPGLRAAFKEKMRLSGLTDPVVRKLHFRPTSLDAAPKELPFAEDGFVIPYFDLAGKQTKFFRYRYLKQPKRSGFAGVAKHKAIKYTQPAKTNSELYLPPLVDWRKVAKNAAAAVIITEGELKSACATAHTPYPCIGIGGVWSWRSAGKHQPHLPMFDEFKWEGRPVYIVYDSDAVTNPMVMQAENALAKMLLDKGAEPHIVRLPGEGENKCGVDDFIVAKGAKAFEELLADTETWNSAQELHALNEEVLYVREPGLIIRLDSMQRLSPRSFIDHAYATRIYYEEVASGKTTKLVARSAPAEWIKWPSRAEVPRAVYAPGEPRITASGELNVWGGWAVEPAPGDVKPWKELLDLLFQGEPASRAWFEQWCAYPLQNPGVKMFTSSVLWGLKHGTGKSLVGYSLGKIYGSNFTEIRDEDLRASHNEWAENKQFVMGDEITGGDKRSSSDRMKSLITQQQLRLNPKYIPSYIVKDCINYYFTSNHPDSFFLEDDDRRYFIHEVTSTPHPDSFYKTYENWLGASGVIGPGVPALFHHLLHLPLGGFNPKAHAPMTKAKEEMLSDGRSDIATWVRRLLESPDSVLRLDKTVIPNEIWRGEELLKLYDPEERTKVSVNGLGRELKRQGFKKCAGGNGIFTENDGQVRLWAIRNRAKWEKASNTACGEQYDRERGGIGKQRKHK